MNWETLKKAEKLIAKAEKRHYRFPFNKRIESNRSINLLKTQIHLSKDEYQLARNSLDSILVPYDKDNTDSIKISTYQMEFGSDSLKKWCKHH